MPSRRTMLIGGAVLAVVLIGLAVWWASRAAADDELADDAGDAPPYVPTGGTRTRTTPEDGFMNATQRRALDTPGGLDDITAADDVAGEAA